MNALRKEGFPVETEYLNELAGSQNMSLTVNYDCNLSEEGLDWSDVRQVCRCGSVTISSMLEQRGLWTVQGHTLDEDLVEMDVAVEAEEMNVELLRATKLSEG